MREIHVSEITKVVKELCIESNYYLSKDVKEALQKAKENETWELAENILDKIILNSNIAKNEDMPICQDTGMACVFMEIGQDVHIIGGLLEDAINEGVRQGYDEGFLRKSVVKDPLDRVNTNDNTPAIIYYDIVQGDKIKITVSPKGFGSENMSRIKMLKPSDGLKGVKDFIIETVMLAGPNPCPPIVIGVGIGGTFDKAAYLAKKALIRPLDKRNSKEFYSNLEEELLEAINKLGIGPQGFGGKTTALGVNIETYPTHIAGLPVAVNINCHVTRQKEENDEIGHICEEEHCHCNENGVFKSALKHTVNIFLFIILITFIINIVVYFVGEETIASWILNKPVIGPMITSLIGLIPNCAASVIITNLYLENVISLGSMIAGLLTGAGVGLAVLFKTNNKLKENIGIVALVYIIGVIVGMIIELLGIII